MSFSLQDVKREDVNYFRGQTSLPYLAIQDNFTSEELARYLLNPPSFAICKDRPAVCQYKGFKTASLCSHSFAVADHVAKLHEYLSWFHSLGGPNITAAASTSTPKNAGKKPGQKSFIWRTGVIASSRNDDSYTDRRLYVETASVKNEQRYHLK